MSDTRVLDNDCGICGGDVWNCKCAASPSEVADSILADQIAAAERLASEVEGVDTRNPCPACGYLVSHALYCTVERDAEISRLRGHVEYLKAALQKITGCEGRYSRVPITYASNVIEDMARVATKALDGTWERPEEPVALTSLEESTMIVNELEHHPNCRSDYPEKPKDELPQSTTDVDFGDGEAARTCNDCGAFVIVSTEFNCIECGEPFKSSGRLCTRCYVTNKL